MGLKICRLLRRLFARAVPVYLRKKLCFSVLVVEVNSRLCRRLGGVASNICLEHLSVKPSFTQIERQSRRVNGRKTIP
jgi:hypothetical protein